MPVYVRCPWCGAEFGNAHALRKHVERVHLVGPGECPCCGEPYRSRRGLVAHASRHSDDCHTAVLFLAAGREVKKRLGASALMIDALLTSVFGVAYDHMIISFTVCDFMGDATWSMLRPVLERWFEEPPPREEVWRLDPFATGRCDRLRTKSFKMPASDYIQLSRLAYTLRMGRSAIVRAAYCAARGGCSEATRWPLHGVRGGDWHRPDRPRRALRPQRDSL